MVQTIISRLRGIRQWLTRKRIIMLLLVAGGSVTVIGIGAYEFIAATESAAFCGTVCHTPMYPEYTTFQASPHSFIQCSNCHVGAGSYNLITSKARGIPQIYQTLTGSYERPIPTPIKSLRPARETCEKCHTPSKFTGFLLRTGVAFKTDEVNTKQTDTIVLNVGGGTSGVASGIHWHTVSKVWYLPLDDKRLEIGWVGVEKDGDFKEYVNPSVASSITPERIEAEKRLMDCVDCHNRASHIFHSPNDLIDQAMEEGAINASIPFIKRESLNAIGSPRPSLKDAYTRIDAIEQFYQDNYPRFYTDNATQIDEAVNKLKEIAVLTTFPEMRVDWNTHADNSGHNKPPDELLAGTNITFQNWRTNQSPGCFRCHWKLVPVTRDTVPAKPLDASCNLCHYSLTSQPGSPVPRPMPHPTEGLENCLLCHGQSGLKPFPEDHPWTNNDACTYCHQLPQGSVSIPLPPVEVSKNIPHASKGLEDCLLCHAPGSLRPFGADHPWTTIETCNACHKPAAEQLPLPSAAPLPDTIPSIPHSNRGLENCLLCHGSASPRPFVAAHPWSTNETCYVCHVTAKQILPVPPSINLAPRIPHSIDGLSDCRLCHGASGTISYPTNHTSIPTSFCTLCHTPG